MTSTKGAVKAPLATFQVIDFVTAIALEVIGAL